MMLNKFDNSDFLLFPIYILYNCTTMLFIDIDLA